MKKNLGNNTFKNTRMQGFTLLELLIVVSAIAILAAIAVPAYHEYTLKAWRAEGRTALLNLMQEQERYFAQRGTYKNFSSSSDAGPFKYYSGNNYNDSAYALSALTCVGETEKTCIMLVATSKSPKTDPKISQLTYKSDGTKNCTLKSGTDSSVCW